MKKADIVARVAGRAGLSKSVAEAAVNAVLDAIAEGLAKEEQVRIAGFGTFATKDRRARTGRNPRTGESVSIPASKAPSFKAGKALRDVVCRGWQAKAGDRRDAGDTRQLGDGDSGTRLDVSKWPGGVAPVWTMLDPESAQALRAEPSAERRALRLASDLADEEFEESAFVRNALVVLERTAEEGWLWLTDKGNFRRDTVAALRESMTWPGMEATEQFRTGKAFREGDVWELHLLHRLVDLAGLVEGRAGLCQLTALGREMLKPGRRGVLQAFLFRHAFWHADLSRFVETFPRGLQGRWPQDDVGVILWGLSNVADEWQSVDALRAMSAVRDDAVARMHWNAEGTMFVGRILGPLRWFGLLEYRGPPETFEVGWRKSALFDRFLSFDVRLADGASAGH